MATTKWVVDPTHSNVGFKVKHMMFTNVSGKFEKFDASATLEEHDFFNAKFNFSADIMSITTGNTERDNHLKSADFFDVERFSKIEFESNSVEKLTENKFKLSGNLLLHGVSKEVVLDVDFEGLIKDPWGNTRAGFSLSGKINRKDWGLNWNSALEAGGVLVGEMVSIQIDIQLIKQ